MKFGIQHRCAENPKIVPGEFDQDAKCSRCVDVWFYCKFWFDAGGVTLKGVAPQMQTWD